MLAMLSLATHGLLRFALGYCTFAILHIWRLTRENLLLGMYSPTSCQVTYHSLAIIYIYFSAMADQITTVASLPPGYGTLAGTVYAMSASTPTDWNDIARAKTDRVPRSPSLRSFKQKPTPRLGANNEAVVRSYNFAEYFRKSQSREYEFFGPY